MSREQKSNREPLAEALARCEQEVRRRREVERELREEQRLLKQLLELHDQERKLLSYEVHDGFAQELTAAILNLQAFRQLLPQNADEAWRAYDRSLELLGGAMAETRRLIAGLRPPILDEAGLVPALEFLAFDMQRREGIPIEFVHRVDFQRLAPPVENALFRIVQEALTNACRHSHSPRVRVELSQTADAVREEIRDWGVGFDPEQVEEGHFGLRGIRERARLLGGSARIASTPGAGTQVVAELPLAIAGRTAMVEPPRAV